MEPNVVSEIQRPKYQHVVLNSSRWETETVVEWLLYYKSIGFDHCYIYCNDDDPYEMYSRIISFIEGDEPFVTFHHLPYQGQQDSCWMHFLSNHKHECEWFMFVDGDEFLALKPTNSIKTFMAEREDKADCIFFNWIWFGPQDFLERPAGSTLTQFIRRENLLERMDPCVKTMTRSSCVDLRFLGYPPDPMLNHRWPAPVQARMRSMNVLGEPMDEYLSEFPKSGERYLSDTNKRQAIFDTAITYHYLFRSREDFIRRVRRGTLGAYYFQPMWGNVATSTDGTLDKFISILNHTEDRFLADYWNGQENIVRRRARATTIVQPNEKPNLALGSTPHQSSTSPWSKGDIYEDAKGAISGVHTGSDGFHTNLEDNPYWQTDLGHICELTEIRVFNSLKNRAFAGRAYPLKVEVSQDGASWKTIFINSTHAPFGGADGHPLIIRLKSEAQYVKLSLMNRDFFHLDEIEIY
ncbi:hypothetical protein E4V01_05655 [Methylorubrum sp. Q1]|nr:hypothetical protein E4V01_05655 [Methylorubrum sp. Q1]